MTMHLVGPYLTTTGKKRGKKKWASAEQKRKAEELQQSWDTLSTKWKKTTPTTKMTSPSVKLPVNQTPHVRDTGPRPPSLNSWHTGAVSSKPTQHYTGDKMMGITVLHKSCLQPVFNQQEMEDAAKMRR